MIMFISAVSLSSSIIYINFGDDDVDERIVTALVGLITVRPTAWGLYIFQFLYIFILLYFLASLSG